MPTGTTINSDTDAAAELRKFLGAPEPFGSLTDDLLRELIEEVKGLRADLKMHEIRTGKRFIGL